MAVNQRAWLAGANRPVFEFNAIELCAVYTSNRASADKNGGCGTVDCLIVFPRPI
jgi:hypothetical protein